MVLVYALNAVMERGVAISRWTAAVTHGQRLLQLVVSGGGRKAHMGVASDCDNPFLLGGVDAFDQATGDRISTYYSVPGGGNGGRSLDESGCSGRR